MRMLVPDKPGVLASVAGALAAHSVSIERVIQQRGPGDDATLVLVTHPSTGAAVHSALEGLELRELAIMPILEEGNL